MEHALPESADKPAVPGPDAPSYRFFGNLARTLNSGQSRSVLLAGEVHDLYFDGDGYVPLLAFLNKRCAVAGIVQIVLELNGPIRLVGGEGWDALRRGWVAWKAGGSADALTLAALVDRSKQLRTDMLEAEFDAAVADATGKPTVALEFLRQLCLCSRSRDPDGRAYIPQDLLIYIEEADFLLPAGGGDVGRMNQVDRHRVAVACDWFGDAAFMSGRDSVVLLAESRGQVAERVGRLPSVITVEVPPPDADARRHYLHHFRQHIGDFTAFVDDAELAALTAGLSTHALRQMLLAARHSGDTIDARAVVGKVEQHLSSTLGEDVVEFKKPSHSLDDVVGFDKLKAFLRRELMPRIKSDGPDALPGAAVAGPIGGGKTFVFEAVAAELGLPVLVLKNIRSQWFGQTDVLFEKLRRALESLGKVVIFVDEADTQFGGVGEGSHETERRLTGKVQQMMSDPRLRGRVTWLLMTARIHRLSPDIRRPGRVGDLIIPVLDPVGDDRLAFIRWMIDGRVELGDRNLATVAAELDPKIEPTSAAAFAALRDTLKARQFAEGRKLTVEEIEAVLHDMLPADIGPTRRYQELQALVNCTRRSLLPEGTTPDDREAWATELAALELRGIS
jgi:SpoVK/Ycf46/Vps4 family AAA+-type ATPase